jgi:cyclohexadieny/prephenate dehydrogenase
MRVATLAIVGVGLIGGSIALAARRRGVADRIIGVDDNSDARAFALRQGVVTEASDDLGSSAAVADLIVFCTPVHCLAAQVLKAASHCRPGTLLTDVGSTKARIVADVQPNLPPNVSFVGGHPLAGSEKQGAQHADADLFVNRLVVVTETPETDKAAQERIIAFWQTLGASVRLMSPQEHDDALALTSHLPHLAAAALAGVLPPHWYELTATGFRDTTRLAASNPALWTGIFRTNPEAVLHSLDRFLSQLQHFRDAIAADDPAALLALLEQGKKVKDGLQS